MLCFLIMKFEFEAKKFVFKLVQFVSGSKSMSSNSFFAISIV